MSLQFEEKDGKIVVLEESNTVMLWNDLPLPDGTVVPPQEDRRYITYALIDAQTKKKVGELRYPEATEEENKQQWEVIRKMIVDLFKDDENKPKINVECTLVEVEKGLPNLAISEMCASEVFKGIQGKKPDDEMCASEEFKGIQGKKPDDEMS